MTTLLFKASTPKSYSEILGQLSKNDRYLTSMRMKKRRGSTKNWSLWTPAKFTSMDVEVKRGAKLILQKLWESTWFNAASEQKFENPSCSAFIKIYQPSTNRPPSTISSSSRRSRIFQRSASRWVPVARRVRRCGKGSDRRNWSTLETVVHHSIGGWLSRIRANRP